MIRRIASISTAAVLALLLAGGPAAGQQRTGPDPTADFVVAGYGTVGYTSVLNRGGENDFSHDFSAAISPIMLFSMGEDFLFEAEFEFELAGSETETAVEYAQVDYLGFDRVQLTVGKFLLPFGLFSERFHPSWINKMPGMPLVYGHAHGGVAEGALLPVLADIGVMGRWSQPLDDGTTLDVSAWVTQGPRAVAPDGDAGGGDHAHSVALWSRGFAPTMDVEIPGGEAGHLEVTGLDAVAFGTNTTDNNENKMLGARAGIVAGGKFEVYLSGFHSMYDDDDFLDLYAGDLAFEWRPERFEVRGEGAIVWQELILEEAGSYETLESPGYYLQISRRYGTLEPVVRWSHLPDAEVASAVARHEVRQLAVGLDYWFAPSIPVKAAFEWNLDGPERLLFQWAYGF